MLLSRCQKSWASSEKQFLVLLGFTGSILFVAALFFCFYIPQTPGRLERASVALFKEFALWSWISSVQMPLTNDPFWIGGLLIMMTLLAFTAYGLIIVVTWRRKPTTQSLRIILAITALLFFASMFALPNLNTDIFNYILQARVTTAYDSNPHYIPASNFPDDPTYPYASARIATITGDKFAVWTWLSAGLSNIAGDNPLSNLLLFRLTFLLVNFGNLFLIYSILKKISPSHVLTGLLFYAWNPIVVISGQSKTDTVMVFFLLVGIYFLIVDRKHLAIISLAGSVLIKAITLPVLAIYWVNELWNRHYKTLLLSVLIFVATVIIAYAPLWEGPELVRNHLGVLLGEAGASIEQSGFIKKGLLLPIFCLSILVSGAFRKDCHARLIKRCAIVMLVFAILLSRISNSWYLITPITVIALTQEWKIALAAIAITFSAFLFNVWYSTSTQVFKLPELFETSSYFMFLMPVAIIGLAVAGLVSWRRRHLKKPVLTTFKVS